MASSGGRDGRDAGPAVGPNDVLRFGLEVAALGALAYWGWTAAAGTPGAVLAVALPLVAAALWGTFRVPNDPGPAPVAVPGAVRLGLEWALFGLAGVGLAVAGRPTLAAVLVIATTLHYVLARDRVRWLLAGGTGAPPERGA